jgi:hypothetical protein
MQLRVVSCELRDVEVKIVLPGRDILFTNEIHQKLAARSLQLLEEINLS